MSTKVSGCSCMMSVMHCEENRSKPSHCPSDLGSAGAVSAILAVQVPGQRSWQCGGRVSDLGSAGGHARDLVSAGGHARDLVSARACSIEAESYRL